MPFVKHRGQRIHYTVDGDGPLIVLQHGLLMSGESWKRGGIVDALTDRYRIACVDSLGHGESDKPHEPALYHQMQRAGDIVAVLDDLDCERAHLVGHSMGAWLRDDTAHDQRKALAEAAGLAFISTAGDHLGMLLVHGAEAAKSIRAFAARCST